MVSGRTLITPPGRKGSLLIGVGLLARKTEPVRPALLGDAIAKSRKPAALWRGRLPSTSAVRRARCRRATRASRTTSHHLRRVLLRWSLQRKADDRECRQEAQAALPNPRREEILGWNTCRQRAEL